MRYVTIKLVNIIVHCLSLYLSISLLTANGLLVVSFRTYSDGCHVNLNRTPVGTQLLVHHRQFLSLVVITQDLQKLSRWVQFTIITAHAVITSPSCHIKSSGLFGPGDLSLQGEAGPVRLDHNAASGSEQH